MPSDPRRGEFARTLHVRVKIPAVRPGEFALDVHFEARPGITILFGPSGSGKSTTLGVIAGLRRPGAGRVSLGDEVWIDTSEKIEQPMHHRGVSLVFQSLALFPHMNAVHNVEYGIDRQIAPAERKRRAIEALERMRVPHLAERRPRTFSGGEAQRVALARAFARQPKVVLLDEAFSALDRDLRRELLGDVRRGVLEAGIPAIMVTHHRMEALAMGDWMVMMDAGRVIGSGKVNEMMREEAEVASSREDALDGLDKTPMPLVGFTKGRAT